MTTNLVFGPSLTGYYYNFSASVPWANASGDWSDSTQTAQGSSSYATITCATIDTSPTADITTLVARHLASGNTGIFLKSSGGSAYLGQTDFGRPTLTVVTSTGTTVLAATASNVLNISSATPITTGAANVGGGVNMVCQFDYTTLTGTLTSATLAVRVETTPSGGNLLLAVHEVRAPTIVTDVTPVYSGLATSYPGDVGILAHPDVYFALDLTDANHRTQYLSTQGAWGADNSGFDGLGTDPRFGIPMHKHRIVSGGNTATSSWHAWGDSDGELATNPQNGLTIHESGSAGSNGTTWKTNAYPDSPSEAYFRYVFRPKTGYSCSVETMKIPGLFGQFGSYDGAHYGRECGNGGNPCTGNWTTSAPDYFCGWSARNQLGKSRIAGDPYSTYRWPHAYLYHVGQGVGSWAAGNTGDGGDGSTGDALHWGNHTDGWPLIGEETSYSFEFRLKMNTFTGATDGNGNRTGVADGILEAWINGVKFLSRTDLIWSNHPAFKIMGTWLDTFHGGGAVAEKDHPFWIGGIVMARSYIGPPAPSVRIQRRALAGIG